MDISWDTSVLEDNSLLQDPLKDVMDYYYDALVEHVIYSNINANTRIKFTYSAMHGVGYPYMLQAFNVAKFMVRIKLVSIRILDLTKQIK